jgi:hypothetical protein
VSEPDYTERDRLERDRLEQEMAELQRQILCCRDSAEKQRLAEQLGRVKALVEEGARPS